MWGTLWQDVRFGCRTLIKAPSFAIAVIGTIALGVGATTAIFSVVNGVVLSPLPFPESERVVILCEPNPQTGSFCGASPSNVADWVRMGDRLQSAGVARGEGFIAQVNGEVFGVRGGIATPGFFDVLRLRPAFGRLPAEADMNPGANHVVVVSHRFWQQRLGSDPSIVGRSVSLDGAAYTVIGVLPADAFIPRIAGVEVWKPLTASIENVENRGWRGFTAIGRMAAGTNIEQLGTELETLRAQLQLAYPEDNTGWTVHAESLRNHLVGDTRRALWIFMGAVGFVLLIACANVASLFLVRTSRRSGEFAVRVSLGAGRRRILQQLLTESVLVTLAGGVGGLALAVWGTRSIVALAPASIPRINEVTFDGRVALFAFALTTVIAALFGVVASGRVSRTNLAAALSGLRQTQAAESRLRSLFVVAELALAFMLLVGAGLLTRSFGQLMAWEPGFERANLAVSFMLPPSGVYGTADNVVAVMDRARAEVMSVPGVESAGLASGGPLFGGGDGVSPLTVEGRPPATESEVPPVEWYDVDPHFFKTLGLPIVRGRDLSTTDAAGTVPVALVNETLVRRFFPDEDPIGRRVTVRDHPAEIVGVVADGNPERPDRPTTPQVYWPIQQYPRGAAYLLVRTADLDGVEKVVRSRVTDIDPRISLSPFVRLDETFERGLTQPRFNMALVTAFAVVALTLAVVGIFGVIANTVASRAREIGVRMALGATPGNVVGQVIRQGMTLVATGLALGLAGALAGGRLLESLLYGLPPRDVPTLVATVTMFAAVSALACWVPSRRAARVDPVRALRME